MTKDFSNPKELGFLRVFEVIYALNIVCTIFLLAFVNKNSYEINAFDLLDVLNLMMDGVIFWLIWQRKAATRTVVIVFSVFNIVVDSGLNIFTGNFHLLDIINLLALDIVQLAYFTLSERVKVQLNEPFSHDIKDERAQRHADFYRPNIWPFWRNLIMYFFLFSIVGHWMEAGYCTFIKWGWIPGIYDPNSQIWSDWLYPFPVYGFGTVACILILYPIKCALQKHLKNTGVALVISFVINGLVCTSIELIMGLTQNQDHQLWDYSTMFCNFMGQICLQNGTGFAVISTLMTWVIYPALEDFLERFRRETINLVFVVVTVLSAILFAFYLVNIVLPDPSQVPLEEEVVSDATTRLKDAVEGSAETP